ncbi:MAG: hypothetical protein DRN04_19640 [Thermoprotei archaeon]|nr:MAG: hypothetical protein DRN04_19640 [Thermoprotei archaeon]
MKKVAIIAVTVLILILGGVLYSIQRRPYTTPTPETVESTGTPSPTSTSPSPTETSPTPTTQYFQRKEVKVPLKIIRYNFTSDKGFERIFEVTSATAYYYLTVEDVVVTGENPKLTVGLKIMVASETRYTGLFHEVNLKDIKLPYTVKGEDWVYITGDRKAEYIISADIHNAKVQGELTIVLQEPIELDYNKEYFIKGNYGFLLFKIRNSENNLILLKKSPVGGKIVAIQPVSDCLVTMFSFNRWTPTGVVAELNSVIIPSYYVTWGGHTVKWLREDG